MAYHFRNLVFEGGGVKGIAYVGALGVLERKGILKDVVRVGGTSAGAINAALVGLAYTPSEMKAILAALDFKKFLDDSWGILRDANRLISDFGWYKGDTFRRWIADLVKDRTGNSEATFADLQAQKPTKGFRDLYFIGVNLSTGFAEVFSHEHTPSVCVADAVRISMSIPLFFAAKRSLRDDVYVDGGVLDNYPVKLFDREKYVEQYGRKTDYYTKHNAHIKRQGKKVSPYIYNKETLGFRLDSAKEIAVFRDHAEPVHEAVGDFFDYAWALIKTMMSMQNSIHLHSDDWQRTIYIDTLGIGTTDFGLTKAKKDTLVRSGEQHTDAYFKWFDDLSTDPAVNHPQVKP